MWVDPSGRLIKTTIAVASVAALRAASVTIAGLKLTAARHSSTPNQFTASTQSSTQQVVQQTTTRASTVTQPASQQAVNTQPPPASTIRLQTQQTQQSVNTQPPPASTIRPQNQETIRRTATATQHTSVNQESIRRAEVQFNNRTVTQNNNLFDPNFVDVKGRTNVQRMQNGLAPIGYDGRSVNIHHINQTNNSPLMEISTTTHRQAGLHQNTGQLPSRINRQEFNTWRGQYWRWRTGDFR